MLLLVMVAEEQKGWTGARKERREGVRCKREEEEGVREGEEDVRRRSREDAAAVAAVLARRREAAAGSARPAERRARSMPAAVWLCLCLGVWERGKGEGCHAVEGMEATIEALPPAPRLGTILQPPPRG